MPVLSLDITKEHKVIADFLNTLTDKELAEYAKDSEADAYLSSIEAHEEMFID